MTVFFRVLAFVTVVSIPVFTIGCAGTFECRKAEKANSMEDYCKHAGFFAREMAEDQRDRKNPEQMAHQDVEFYNAMHCECRPKEEKKMHDVIRFIYTNPGISPRSIQDMVTAAECIARRNNGTWFDSP